MKRLLIVITRMYVRQGDKQDEFVEIWGGAGNTEHRIFSLQTGTRDDYVLVLHGYEYPHPVTVATIRACTAVERGIKSTDLLPRLAERRTGVIFHPRQSWIPEAQRQLAIGIRSWLHKSGAHVDYIEAYHHGSIIDRRLARACLDRQDFSSVLDELWTHFLNSAVARYDRQLESLTKELKAVLSSICKEFGVSRVTDTTGEFQIPGDMEQTAHGALSRARQLVLDDREDSHSVFTLTWEVAEKVDEKKKEKLIAALAELEHLFSPNDLRYQQVESLLQSAEPEGERFPATNSDAPGSKVVNSNPLNTWCQAVLKSLSDLVRTFNE